MRRCYSQMQRVIATVGMLSLVIMTVMLGPAATVRAATVTASVFTDPVPGACATSGTGACSLREAVIFANANPGTTIQLLAGTYALSLSFGYSTPLGANLFPSSAGTLLLTTGTTIIGAGAASTTIDASNFGAFGDAVLKNFGTGSAIRGVTITGGAGNYSISPNGGGGVINDTGASLTLADSQITRNTSGSHGPVFNLGTMTVTNATIADNTAGNHAGGNAAFGGIENTGTFTLNASSVRGNVVGGYSITSAGGGIGNYGTMTIIGSTISGNSASSSFYPVSRISGGIRNDGGTLTITDSTVSGNSASNGGDIPAVGGVMNEGVGGHIVLNYVTVAGNSSGHGIDGVYNGASQSMTLTGTLLSNTDSNCGGSAFTDGDYNLSSDGSCTSLAGAHDRTNADPKLGPLMDNGSPTQTQALLTGSAALDAGGTSVNGCPATDQRGIARPQGAACDIGAFEVQIAPTPAVHTAAPTVGSAPHPNVPAPITAPHQTAPTATVAPGTSPTATPVPLPQPARH